MTTIANLVIAASVDPQGVRTGLDQAQGFVRQYATILQQEVKESLSTFGATSYGAGNLAADSLVKGLQARFNENAATLREQLARGVIDRAAFTTAGAQSAQAFNAALLVGIEELRGKQILSPETQQQLVGQLKEAGIRAGEAYQTMTTAVSTGATMQLAGMGRIRQGLTSLVAQYTGTIPVLDRIGTSLLTMGAGGTVALGVVAGIALIAGAYHYLTAESRELAKETDKAIASLKEWYKTSQQGPGGKFGVDLDLAEKQLAVQKASLAMLAKTASGDVAEYGRGNTYQVGAIGEAGLAQREAARLAAVEAKKQYDELAKEVAAGEIHVREMRRAAATSGETDFTRNLAGAISGGIATKEQVDNGLRLLEFYHTEARRLARSGDLNAATNAQSNADTLDQALHPKDTSQKDADKAWRDHVDAIKAVIDAQKSLESANQSSMQVGSGLLSAYQRVNLELAKMTDLTSKHASELIRMRDEMQKTQLVAALSSPLPQLSNIGAPVAPGTSALAGAPADAVKTAQDLLERQRLLTAARMQDTQAYRDTIDAMRIVQGYIDGAITREGLTNDRLREQLALKQALAPIMDRAAAPQLVNEVNTARQTREQAQVAAITGAPNAAELERAANVQRDAAVDKIRAIIAASSTWKDVTETERASLAALLSLLGQLGDKTKQSSDDWNNIKTAISGVVDAASGLSKIPASLAVAVHSAENLVDSLKKAAATRDAIEAKDKASGGSGGISSIFSSVGNVASMLGPVGSAIGSAIGIAGSIGQMFSQHDAALDANTQRLKELTAAMVDTKGVGGQQLALADIQKWQAQLQKYQADGMRPPGANLGLDDIVKASGMTLDQFNKIASDLGIQFGKGTDWVNQFGAALQQAIKDSTQFGKSLSDQQSIADLRLKVSGNTLPSAKINEELQLLGQFAPKLRDQLGQIDVTSAEGRVALRNALKTLVDQMMAGTLTADQLGQLQNVKALAGIVDALTSGLDSLASSAGAAASAINGVSWYRLNQAIYDVAPQIGQPAQGFVPGAQDTTPSIPTGSGSASTNVTLSGDIIISTPLTDPEKLRKIVLTAMQQKAQSSLGDTKLWPQVQT